MRNTGWNSSPVHKAHPVEEGHLWLVEDRLVSNREEGHLWLVEDRRVSNREEGHLWLVEDRLVSNRSLHSPPSVFVMFANPGNTEKYHTG